jgi:hypothetical protein
MVGFSTTTWAAALFIFLAVALGTLSFALIIEYFQERRRQRDALRQLRAFTDEDQAGGLLRGADGEMPRWLRPIAARIPGWTPPERWKSVHGHNPAVLCYSGPDARWAAFEGERLPAQYINYQKTIAFQETGKSPKEPLPVLSDWQEEVLDDGVLLVTFTADREFTCLPLIWWDRDDLVADAHTRRTCIRYVDVHAGENCLHVPVAGKRLSLDAELVTM